MADDDRITLAHGAGGRLSQELLKSVILPELGNSSLNSLHDGAVLNMAGKLAFTTDSYVVKPLFFAGGSIGRLAVCGTVNDLAMSGAAARYLSLAFILEEGLKMEVLRRILRDIKKVAEEAGVKIVTGDTKVVGKGAADGIFINTAGVGEVFEGVSFLPQNIEAGMDIVLSGFIGDHAATVLAGRHDLVLPAEIHSDCQPLNRLVAVMTAASNKIAVMRDPTRGGVAAVLNELAEQSGRGMLIEEPSLPVREAVRGICDLLGFDPLYLANEGKLIAIMPKSETPKVLRAMRSLPEGEGACVIGEVTEDAGEVGMVTNFGSTRVVDLPLGALVPRIC